MRCSLLVLLLFACARPVATDTWDVRGELAEASLGDVYLFLYDEGEGPPQNPGLPRFMTAVPRVRIEAGDRTFVFADVPEGRYRLWGFADLDRNVGLEPLFAQPGAGDRLIAPQTVVGPVLDPVAFADVLRSDPPAFFPEGESEVPDLPLTPFLLTLISTQVGGVGGEGFEISLSDADGDGVPDDADGDGVPDLFPQILLRFLPRPGQPVPADGQGRSAEIVVPLRYSPGPFLLALGGDPNAFLRADRLTVALIPQAIAVFRGDGGRRFTTALQAIPPGDYELVVLSRSGQLWSIPNPRQPTQFTVTRSR